MSDITITKDDSKKVPNIKKNGYMIEIKEIVKSQILESSEQRSESRFRFFTWFVSFVIVIIGFAIGYNVVTNKNDFKELEDYTKKTIDEMVGKQRGEPKVIAYSEIGKDLEGSTIDAALYTIIESGKTSHYLEFTMYFKNIGDKMNDSILLKYYFKDISVHGRIKTASDEKDYLDDMIYDSTRMPNAGKLYPSASLTQNIILFTGSIEKNPDRLHPSMIKVYYGGKEPFVAKFNLKIKEHIGP